MSRFDNLFNSTVIASCGACRDNKLCEPSILDTLRANGLPLKYADELRGLSTYSSTMGSSSEASRKLTELREQITTLKL